MKLAGIEIGGTKLQVVLGSADGTIFERRSHIIDARQGATVIRQMIEEDLKSFGRIDGVGAGFGGPVNRIDGTIWTSYHVEGWTGFNLKNWLEELTGAPAVVDNDANVAALAEAMGEPYDIVFYTTIGSGVGAGVTINKKIYHGQVGGELEFGHVRLDPSGLTVQQSCSGWAVNSKVLEAASGNPSGKLGELAKQFRHAEAKALLPAIQAGDAQAMEILNALVTDFAFGLSHIVHLFHPDTIIIGGGISQIGETLRKGIEEKLKDFTMDAFQPGPVIQLSKLGTDVVPVGALILAGQQIKTQN